MAAPRTGVTVRPATAADAGWIERLALRAWGTPSIVVADRLYTLGSLQALVAVAGPPRHLRCGLLTYRRERSALHIVSLDARPHRRGTGTALVASVAALAAASGRRRLWLATTNDNVEALRFYQRREFRLVRLRPGAMAAARAIKPEIPLVGRHRIPVRDELVLERRLD